MFRLTPVVKYLLIINVALFALTVLLPNLHLSELLPLYYYESSKFMPHQIITHIFMHADIGHLFHNMLPLIFLGPMLEQVLGGKRFLQFYLICGFGATLLHAGVQFVEYQQMKNEAVMVMEAPTPENTYFFIENQAPRLLEGGSEIMALTEAFSKNPEDASYKEQAKDIVKLIAQTLINSSSLRGASGAVFGIMMAFMLLFPNLRLMLLFPPIPMKAKYLVGLMTVYEIYALLERNPNDNVAHLAHLGGMLFAFILIRYVWKLRRLH